MKAGFGTEEYFVWLRFDGATSVKDLILMTGLAIDRAVAIVRELRRRGAILAPGETEPYLGKNLVYLKFFGTNLFLFCVSVF